MPVTANRRYKVLEKYAYTNFNQYSISMESTRKAGVICDMYVDKKLYDELKLGTVVRVALFIDKPKKEKSHD